MTVGRACLVIVVSTVLPAAGCGGGQRPQPDGGDASTDGPGQRTAALEAFDAFVDRLAAAICAWEFRCCSLNEINLIGGSRYLDEADCRGDARLTLNLWFSGARVAVGEDRLSLDEQPAAACVARFASGSCSSLSLPMDPWAQFETCPNPFVGNTPIGERCFTHSECVPEGRCLPGALTVDPFAGTSPEGVSLRSGVDDLFGLVGTCFAYVQEGEPCRFAQDCAPGLFCRGPEFVCAKPAAIGQPCTPRSTDAISASSIPCDDTSTAILCAAKVCSRMPRDGEPCLEDGVHPPCDTNPDLALSCVGAEFNAPGICRRPGQSGEACGTEGLPPCAIHLTCLREEEFELGVCGPPPVAGQVCSLASGCAPGALCEWTETKNICVRSRRLRDGESCRLHSDCASFGCSGVLSDEGNGVCLQNLDTIPACTGRGAEH